MDYNNNNSNKSVLFELRNIFSNPNHDEGPHEVEPGLYIGSSIPASNKVVLKAIGITHIVTAGGELKPHFPEEFDYCHLLIPDQPSTNILSLLPICVEYITNARRDGGKVYVHCMAGISRSSSIVIAYLMSTYNLKFLEAWTKVQKVRRFVRPNVGFQTQLRKFEKSNYKLEETLSEKKIAEIVKFYRSVSEAKKIGRNLTDTPFACASCSDVLFMGKDINHGFDLQSSNNKYCSYYFLKEVLWLGEYEKYETLSDNDGRLECPSCKYSIGIYNWSGFLCTCNKRICPAFAVGKGDVKAVIKEKFQH